jgi:S-adenosylmethionine hydrolase
MLTFLSDYGPGDEYVGVVHGVIARIAPGVRVLDLGHGVPPQDVRTGARRLARALPFVPAGVHLAVVDPGVGGPRRAVALRAGDRRFVGPDNGLLLEAADRFGGVAEAVEISASPWRLEPVSATFHGRDIFAPVAAHLSAGAPLGDAGDPIDADEIIRLDMPLAFLEGGELFAHAVGFDRFGNVMLDVEHAELTESGFKLGHGVDVNGRAGVYATTFADVAAGELILYEDAYRTLALAVNRGSARELLGIERDGELRIRAR